MKKITIIESLASGTSHRDANLIDAREVGDTLALIIEKESDGRKIELTFDGLSLYHSWGEEETPEWLIFGTPSTGSNFYEIEGEENLKTKKKHYVYFTYDEVLEIFADSFTIKENN